MQCIAVQCNAMQCNAVQCSAVQCSAVQCSAVQCNAMQRKHRERDRERPTGSAVCIDTVVRRCHTTHRASHTAPHHTTPPPHIDVTTVSIVLVFGFVSAGLPEQSKAAAKMPGIMGANIIHCAMIQNIAVACLPVRTHHPSFCPSGCGLHRTACELTGAGDVP